MSSDPPGGRSGPQRRQSIPLDSFGAFGSDDETHDGSRQQPQASRQPPSPGGPGANALPTVSPYWDQPYDAIPDRGRRAESPVDFSIFQAAIPPDFNNPGPSSGGRSPSPGTNPFEDEPPYIDEPTNDYPDADTIPLTSQPQHISGALSPDTRGSQPRDSFQTVSDVGNGSTTPRDMLRVDGDVELGRGSSHRHNFGMSLAPDDHLDGRARSRSRSSSTSGALHRAGSIVRAMSQRVVNISGDAEIAEQRSLRHRSRSPQGSEHTHDRERTSSVFADTSYHSPTARLSAEKTSQQQFLSTPLPEQIPPRPAPNPLKGRTLNLFDSNSPIRLRLCDLLVQPYTEPVILLLIILLAIILTIESAPNVFLHGNGRPDRWGKRWTDWAILALFLVFTVELVARIIVSGFVVNAAEYSTIDRSKGLKAALQDRYIAVFQPHRYKSAKPSSMQFPPAPSTISRSFTNLMQGQQALPATLEEQQRYQLARRAFLRHSFNRLDFVSVVSYWISFILGVTGIESQHHIYLFKMLSCLRILRLLALTHGTSVSLIPVVFHNVTRRLANIVVRSF